MPDLPLPDLSQGKSFASRADREDVDADESEVEDRRGDPSMAQDDVNKAKRRYALDRMNKKNAKPAAAADDRGLAEDAGAKDLDAAGRMSRQQRMANRYTS